MPTPRQTVANQLIEIHDGVDDTMNEVFRIGIAMDRIDPPQAQRITKELKEAYDHFGQAAAALNRARYLLIGRR